MSTVTAVPRQNAAVKLDLKAQLKPLYAASGREPASVTPGEHHYLMVDGRGDPNSSPEFSSAVELLYKVSYHLKFSMKKATGVDYSVMPLEGLWWCEDMSAFSVANKASWLWTLMILQPAFITREMFEHSRRAVAERHKVSVERLRYETYTEGPSAQILHVGPFSEEGPTVQRLHAWIHAAGRQLTGKHHEIYLSDMRRGNPARWKTLIRQPYA